MATRVTVRQPRQAVPIQNATSSLTMLTLRPRTPGGGFSNSARHFTISVSSCATDSSSATYSALRTWRNVSPSMPPARPARMSRPSRSFQWLLARP
jgi:hypothetical protein